jgi:hypothetical protein
LILTIRGQKVLLDADLADIYGVRICRLNEQVKRNADRFTKDFMFRLNAQEAEALQRSRSQIATASERYQALSLCLHRTRGNNGGNPVKQPGGGVPERSGPNRSRSWLRHPNHRASSPLPAPR